MKFGCCPPYFPPADMVGAASRLYESQGYDFLLTGDQLNLTSPRSLWTPDLVPAAGRGVDIDCWMDCFQILDLAAMATSTVTLGPTCDALRRTPVNLAQQLLTLDHISKGRAYICLGAGEMKQFAPYGLKRDKPFTHLEECVKILKLFLRHSEPFSYEGPIWTLGDAMLRLSPFDPERPPPVYVAGGPGRAVEIAGRYADGWATYLPPAGDPEWLAETIADVRRAAEAAGRDPDSIAIMGMFSSLIAPNEELVQEAVESPIVKWDTACIMPSGSTWRRWGAANPLGDDFHYARDFNPFEWSRDDALKIVEQVPDGIVRRSKITGTPAEAADQILPYLEAGVTHALIGNYAQLTATGDWGDATGGVDVVLETVNLLRERLTAQS